MSCRLFILGPMSFTEYLPVIDLTTKEFKSERYPYLGEKEHSEKTVGWKSQCDGIVYLSVGQRNP